MPLPTRIVTATFQGRPAAKVLFTLLNTVSDGTNVEEAGTQTVATLDSSGVLSQALLCQDASLNADPVYDWRPVFGTADWVRGVVIPAGTGSVGLLGLSPAGAPLTPTQFTTLEGLITTEAGTRATADTTNAAAITAETSRAQAAESANVTNIAANTTAITTETTRATTAEAGKVPTSRTVNGHALSADVTVSKADVGLGSVDNTADTAKPVSTAQQAALDLKAPLASPALTGTPTAPTQTAGNNSTRLATTAYADTAVAAQHTADNGTYVALTSHRAAKPLADFGPVGTANDHDTLYAAFTNANCDPVQLPPGFINTAQLDLSASPFMVPVFGPGSGTGYAGEIAPTQTKIVVAAGATGPAIKYGPAAQFHGLLWRDFEVEQQEPTQPCIQLDNTDRFSLTNVLARGGSHGWDLGNAVTAGGDMYGCKAFNQAVSFFHFGAHVVSLQMFAPFGYLSSGATADCAAAVQHDQGANDIVIFGGHLLRAPGIAHKLSKGYYANFAAATRAWTWLWGLQVDGVSTLVSDDSTCAAMWLTNVQQMFAHRVWLSAAPSGDTTVNPIMHLDGVSDSEFTGKFNGRGVVFGTGAACDNVLFDRPLFDSAATTGMFILNAANTAGKAPTNLGVTQPRRAGGVNGQAIPLTDNAAALVGALTPASDLGAGRRDPNTPAIALYDSPGRLQATNSSSFAPTDSTQYISAIDLPAGLPVTNLSFYSGSTGFTRGTNGDSHLWFALVDSSFKIVAVTADDATAWAANAKHTLAISGGPYVTKTSGRYWKVLCITKGTGGTPVNPTIVETAGLSALMNEGTGLGRVTYSATGAAAPPVVGTALAGLNSIGNYLYGWVE